MSWYARLNPQDFRADIKQFYKMITIVGVQWSRFKPRQYVIFFVIIDVICLVLQGTGGGMSGSSGHSIHLHSLPEADRNTADSGNNDTLQTGKSIYLAGISVRKLSDHCPMYHANPADQYQNW